MVRILLAQSDWVAILTASLNSIAINLSGISERTVYSRLPPSTHANYPKVPSYPRPRLRNQQASFRAEERDPGQDALFPPVHAAGSGENPGISFNPQPFSTT